MKSTELRIGNCALHPDGFIIKCYLHEITCQCKFENNIGDYLPFKPIPLTEEILLKCGFRKSKSGMYLFDKFSFDLSDFEFGVESDYYYLTISENLKYLHQLQNLYFALTGQELEINL